jgi:hypothetical protein
MPTLTAVPNIRSQIERGLRAYLTDCAVGTYGQFRLSHDYSERKVIDPTGNRVPLIDIFGVNAVEAVKNSRVETWQVRIDPEYSASTQPNDPNPNWNWTAINNLAGLVMAAMSQTSNAGANYLSTALMISVFGRRLAVLGAVGDPSSTSAADNADMAAFYCDYVEYSGAVGLGKSNGALVFQEQRNFSIRAGNLADDSVFPILTFDGAHTLNWTFTPTGVWPEPAQWNLEKSADGFTWVTQETDAAGTRASGSIAGTGTQYWRVTRTDASIAEYMPESNIVKVTGA